MTVSEKISNEELVVQYQEGDNSALEQLIVGNKNYIFKMALKFRGYIERINWLDIDDLLQEGAIGMKVAAGKFDVNAENKFLTYASYWIYQSMFRCIFSNDSRYKNRSKYFEKSLNESTNIGESEVEEIELLADEDIYPDITWSLSDKQDCYAILELIHKKLGGGAVRLLKLRYGFVDGRERTLKSIADEAGVSIETIRQIEQKAFKAIRNSKFARIRNYEEHCMRRDRVYTTAKDTSNFFSEMFETINSILAKRGECENDK